MSNVPADRKYATTHEWVLENDDGTVTVGITDHAQDQLGDMVYVEVPELGIIVQAEEACAVLESVKAASDIYAPIAGEVVDANDGLSDSPETVNQDPYNDGWIMKLKPLEPGVSITEELMDAAAYETFIEDEDH